MLQSHISKDKFFSEDTQKQLRNTVLGHMMTCNCKRIRYTHQSAGTKTESSPLWSELA